MTYSLFGVKFAPLFIPLERRLQTLAVFYFCSQFLLIGNLTTAALFYLLFTRYYYVSLLYLAWFLYDRNVCYQGGRRSEWLRNSQAWKHFANYFPVKLIKTAELSPDRNYIFGLHPHGILCFSHFVNFGTEGTNFSTVFPNITSHLITLNYQFWLPVHREIFLLSGACSASRKSIEYILSQKGTGNAAAIVVGGAREVLDTTPNALILTLKKRKGFVRMAIKQGASLVPVLSLGENEIFDTLEKGQNLYKRIEEKIMRVLSFPLPIFFGRGVFQYSFGMMPYRKPITTIVGAPIDVEKTSDPSEEQINSLHKRYIEALEKLYEEHKSKHPNPNTKLIIK